MLMMDSLQNNSLLFVGIYDVYYYSVIKGRLEDDLLSLLAFQPFSCARLNESKSN